MLSPTSAQSFQWSVPQMVDGGSSSLHRPTNLTHAPVAAGPLKAAGNMAKETFAGSGHMMNTLHGHILSRPCSKMQHMGFLDHPLCQNTLKIV